MNVGFVSTPQPHFFLLNMKFDSYSKYIKSHHLRSFFLILCFGRARGRQSGNRHVLIQAETYRARFFRPHVDATQALIVLRKNSRLYFALIRQSTGLKSLEFPETFSTRPSLRWTRPTAWPE